MWHYFFYLTHLKGCHFTQPVFTQISVVGILNFLAFLTCLMLPIKISCNLSWHNFLLRDTFKNYTVRGEYVFLFWLTVQPSTYLVLPTVGPTVHIARRLCIQADIQQRVRLKLAPLLDNQFLVRRLNHSATRQEKNWQMNQHLYTNCG